MTEVWKPKGRTWLNSLAGEAMADLDERDIQNWAGHPDPADGGCLPERSARAFADWLWDNWGDFLDGDEDDDHTTVEQVLKGAVTEWCGGRIFG